MDDDQKLDAAAVQAEGLTDWNVTDGALHAQFDTGSFAVGLALVNQVGAAAEAPATAAAPPEAAITPLTQQVQTVANAARGQSLGIDEMAGQLQQVERLIVQNREDVQAAWAASQELQQTARELEELVKYFD